MTELETSVKWVPISCEWSDEIRCTDADCVTATLTEEDEIYTEWGDANGNPVLRDYRWPTSDRPCEHYEPAQAEEAVA